MIFLQFLNANYLIKNLRKINFFVLYKLYSYSKLIRSYPIVKILG